MDQAAVMIGPLPVGPKCAKRAGLLALAGDLPYDYSGLWSALPGDFWEAYRKGEGGRLWWPEETWKEVRSFMAARGLMDAPCADSELNFSRLRRSCAQVLLTHDPALYPGGAREPA